MENNKLNRSVLWEILWTQLVAINYSWSLQGNLTFSVALHKPVIIVSYPIFYPVSAGKDNTKVVIPGTAWLLLVKEVPILTFPDSSRANYLCTTGVIFGLRINEKAMTF